KTFLTDLAHSADYTRAWLEALGEVRPTSTLLGIPALVLPEMLIEIEAEAIIGAAKTRRDIYTQRQREKPRGYARAVEVGDWIWVSGCTSMNDAGEPQASGDWAAQSDLSIGTAQWALARIGRTARGPRGSPRAAPHRSAAASPASRDPSSWSRSKSPP